ncbi:hypothetical protein ABJ384_04960 [Acinetobacter sp. A1-4-2]|uniref:Uncharacterized protein n=1 Tax=Acinetobacter sp. A1-4-2 TaxID=3156489 RepID=A0AAU7SZQ6_9GAMM
MNNNPEQLFKLFYQSINEKMNPYFIGGHNSEGVYRFWHERFMKAFYGIRESRDLESWAEAPQMWLAGYKQGLKENNQE